MRNLYLRADDESALIAALSVFRADGQWVTASHGHALDVIGTLYTPAVLDENGAVVTPAAPLPGFHANLRLWGDMADLVIPVSIIIYPDTPDRIFA